MSTVPPSDPGAETTTQRANPSTTKPKQPGAFRRRAVRAAPAVLIAVIALSFLLTRGVFEPPESKVQTAVDQIRNLEHFPMQVDSVTSWTGVNAEGDALRFDYLIAPSVDSSTVKGDTIRNSVLAKACSGAMKDVMNDGIKLKYAYAFEGASKSFDFTIAKADCATSRAK
ncbi:hypothetical protein GCM10027405_23220 [Arthrobacter alkaliphilus]|uniref:hypothetical protein n=1 Tax=Arthrobacter alkaliphilus TaxID=369936 RepID=UPI001F20ED94|nr:hypothetical protein [Arthrobacter alkaliphilus]